MNSFEIYPSNISTLNKDLLVFNSQRLAMGIRLKKGNAVIQI